MSCIRYADVQSIFPRKCIGQSRVLTGRMNNITSPKHSWDGKNAARACVKSGSTLKVPNLCQRWWKGVMDDLIKSGIVVMINFKADVRVGMYLFVCQVQTVGDGQWNYDRNDKGGLLVSTMPAMFSCDTEAGRKQLIPLTHQNLFLAIGCNRLRFANGMGFSTVDTPHQLALEKTICH